MNDSAKIKSLEDRLSQCEKQIAELLKFKEFAERTVPGLTSAKLRSDYEESITLPAASEVETIVVGGGEQPPITEAVRSHREFVQRQEALTYAETAPGPAEYLSRPLPRV